MRPGLPRRVSSGSWARPTYPGIVTGEGHGPADDDDMSAEECEECGPWVV